MVLCIPIDLPKKNFLFRKSLKILFLLLLTIVFFILISSKTRQSVKVSDPTYTHKNPHFQEIIVHFDFKGAAPKINYLLDLIPQIKKFGATGILLEYEDKFPYHDELENIKAFNPYSISNISAIIRTAEENNLTVIPLVQTFGHLEFVLKLGHYKHFREVEKNPEVLCPSQNFVYLILNKMIDQVLSVHPTAKYFHIGCDEVNFIGMCSKCQRIMKKNKWRKDDLYFYHVRKVATYISATYPKVQPIIWGDKISKQNEKIILQMGIPDLVEVMFWNYKSEKHTFPNTEDMNSYTRLFKHIWVAGAFKGTTGSAQLVPSPEHHLQNTDGWIKIASQWKRKINFKGTVLTGWQRYNHFSVLCELFPVAIPSLALNLQLLGSQNGLNYNEWKETLKCNDFPPLNFIDIRDSEKISRLKCDFPGYNVYHVIHSFISKLQNYKLIWSSFQNDGSSFYNIINNISSPGYVQKLSDTDFESHLEEIKGLEIKLRTALSAIYDEDTVNEWLTTHVVPTQMRFRAAVKILQTLKKQTTWPRRPLESRNFRLQNFFNEICGSSETIGCALLYI